jgi:DNA-binding NarL/FixJ family response regulator
MTSAGEVDFTVGIPRRSQNVNMRSDAASESPVRVLIVADVRLYLEGMRASLSLRPRLLVVGAASTVDDALAVSSNTSPDIAIVDMATKDSLWIVRSLRRHTPAMRVVGFGVEEQEGEILACAEAGLAGYVPNDASLDDLVMRIESVHRGELMCTPRIAATLFRRLESNAPAVSAHPDGLALSVREREVLRLIDRGLSNKEIAVLLHIEVSTVKNHVHNLLDKLKVTSRSQAAARLGTHLSVRQRRVATHTDLASD